MSEKYFEIETERLLIKELDISLAESIHVNSLDQDNRRFMPDEVFESIDAAAEAISRLMTFYGSNNGPLVYALYLKGQTNIGLVEAVPIGAGKWEIGYHVNKLYAGNGYATEAVTAFAPAITQYLQINSLYGICDAENVASCRALEKAGFKLEFDGIDAYHGKQKNILRYIFTLLA